MGESDLPGPTCLQAPQNSRGLIDGFFRTDQGAAPTAMAEFWEDPDLTTENGQCVVLANFNALAAQGAAVLVNHGNLEGYLLGAIHFGVEKEV